MHMKPIPKLCSHMYNDHWFKMFLLVCVLKQEDMCTFFKHFPQAKVLWFRVTWRPPDWPKNSPTCIYMLTFPTHKFLIAHSCRLLLLPQNQSQKPNYLLMFSFYSWGFSDLYRYHLTPFQLALITEHGELSPELPSCSLKNCYWKVLTTLLNVLWIKQSRKICSFYYFLQEKWKEGWRQGLFVDITAFASKSNLEIKLWTMSFCSLMEILN